MYEILGVFLSVQVLDTAVTDKVQDFIVWAGKKSATIHTMSYYHTVFFLLAIGGAAVFGAT